MARPEHKPTPALRKKVSIAAGGGMSHEKIALAIGIDRKTLEKHYALEISVGATQRRLEVIEAMHKEAVGGNVAAQKAFLSITPKSETTQPHQEGEPRTNGKKEQANEDAKTAAAGTAWNELLPDHSRQH
jgi:hypothetical protein